MSCLNGNLVCIAVTLLTLFCSHLHQRRSLIRSRPAVHWPRFPRTWLGVWWIVWLRSDPWSPGSTPPGTATSLCSPHPARVAYHSASGLRSNSRWNGENNVNKNGAIRGWWVVWLWGSHYNEYFIYKLWILVSSSERLFLVIIFMNLVSQKLIKSFY